MSNDTTFTDRAVEQHAVESDEYIRADGTRPVHDRPVSDRGTFSDRYCSTRFGVNDHAILYIGMCTHGDGFHVSGFIHFICPDDGVRADKYILMHYDTSAEDGGWIDKSAFMDDRLITPGVFPDYDNF